MYLYNSESILGPVTISVLLKDWRTPKQTISRL